MNLLNQFSSVQVQAAFPAISFNRRINALKALCEGSKQAQSSGGGVLRCRGAGGAALFATLLAAGALTTAAGGVITEGAGAAEATACGAFTTVGPGSPL